MKIGHTFLHVMADLIQRFLSPAQPNLSMQSKCKTCILIYLTSSSSCDVCSNFRYTLHNFVLLSNLCDPNPVSLDLLLAVNLCQLFALISVSTHPFHGISGIRRCLHDKKFLRKKSQQKNIFLKQGFILDFLVSIGSLFNNCIFSKW